MAFNFTWISNVSDKPYITIDSHERLYISSPARDLIGVKGGRHFKLVAGYDFTSGRIILAKPENVGALNILPFNFDKRSYSRVKPFVEKAQIKDKLPTRYYYVGEKAGEYPKGTFAFEQYQAEK